MKNLYVFAMFFCLSVSVFAQKTFTKGTKYKNDILSVYNSFRNKEYKTEYRYGLYDDKTDKIILPISYKTIWFSKEDDIYIVEDTLKKWSLYSTKTNSFICKNEYDAISVFSDGLSVAQKNMSGEKKFGALDKTGKLVIPFQYKFLGFPSDGFICFSKDKGYGFIDKNNKEIIPPIYRTAVSFSEGLACVSLLDSTQYGYIDKKNKWVIQPTYLRGGNFKENYAVVYTTRNYTKNSDNGGVIDKTGKQIIPLEYDYISIEDNFFIVKKADKSSYKNEVYYGIYSFSGKEILPIEYKSISSKFNTDFYEINKNNSYSLIDKNGRLVTTTAYDYIYTFTDYGLSYLKKDNKYTIVDQSLKTIVPEHGATGVIFGQKNRVALLFKDKVEVYSASGKLLKTIDQENVSISGTSGTQFFKNDDSLKIKFSNCVYLYNIASKTKQLLEYTEVTDFNDDGIFIGKNKGYYFVDYTGKKLSSKSFNNVVNFSEDICAVQEGTYGTPYLADKSFAKIMDLSCVFEGPFSEGLAKAKAQYGTARYYYTKKGNYFTVLEAAEASDFKNGRASIKNQRTNKFYFIDKAGKKINNEEYDEVGLFNENLAGVKKNGKTAYIDTAGNIVIPFKFDIGSPFYKGSAIVKEMNEFYLVNKKGNKINNDVYNGATNPANGTFPVQKGINFGLIDEKGKVLIDFKYQDVTPIYESVALVKKEGMWALMNNDNKALTAFEFDSYGNCKNGYVRVMINNKMGLIDKDGKQILPIIYDKVGSVYNNKILLINNEGTKVITVK